MLKVLSALIVVAQIAGCANQGKARDAEMARIAEWLPGEYSAAEGRLLILPVSSRFIGKQVMYVERTDTAGQIVSQNLYSFDKSGDDKSVVQRTFGFDQPERWARGHQRPEIFRSMVMDDVTATPACDLLWTVGEKVFTGASMIKACRLRKVEFDGDEITLTETGRGAPVTYQRMAIE